jgi:hypothetical protein
VVVCQGLLRADADESSCEESGIVVAGKFNASLRPKVLPKRDLAPVSVALGGEFDYADPASPPALREVIFEFDKNAAVEASGLPTCRRGLLMTLGVKSARRRCRDSWVGMGIAHISIPSESPNPILLRLSLFSGGVRDGTTTSFVHTSLAKPTPRSLVSTVKIKRVEDHRYGLQAVVVLPSIAGGSVLDFELVLGNSESERYAVARCPDGHLNARMEGVFAGGTRLSGSTIQGCSPAPARAGSFRPRRRPGASVHLSETPTHLHQRQKERS